MIPKISKFFALSSNHCLRVVRSVAFATTRTKTWVQWAELAQNLTQRWLFLFAKKDVTGALYISKHEVVLQTVGTFSAALLSENFLILRGLFHKLLPAKILITWKLLLRRSTLKKKNSLTSSQWFCSEITSVLGTICETNGSYWYLRSSLWTLDSRSLEKGVLSFILE